MQFYVLLLCATVALTSAAVHKANAQPKYSKPTQKVVHSNGNEHDMKTLRNEQEINGDGSYHYAYETSNGIVGDEHGIGGVSVQGASSYISPEGVEVKLSYTADETGYHPVGDHIPKTPEYVYKALEYIRLHPPARKEYEAKPSNYHVATKIAPPTQKQVARRVTPAPYKNSGAGKKYNRVGAKFHSGPQKYYKY